MRSQESSVGKISCADVLQVMCIAPLMYIALKLGVSRRAGAPSTECAARCFSEAICLFFVLLIVSAHIGLLESTSDHHLVSNNTKATTNSPSSQRQPRLSPEDRRRRAAARRAILLERRAASATSNTPLMASHLLSAQQSPDDTFVTQNSRTPQSSTPSVMTQESVGSNNDVQLIILAFAWAIHAVTMHKSYPSSSQPLSVDTFSAPSQFCHIQALELPEEANHPERKGLVSKDEAVLQHWYPSPQSDSNSSGEIEVVKQPHKLAKLHAIKRDAKVHDTWAPKTGELHFTYPSPQSNEEGSSGEKQMTTPHSYHETADLLRTSNDLRAACLTEIQRSNSALVRLDELQSGEENDEENSEILGNICALTSIQSRDTTLESIYGTPQKIRTSRPYGSLLRDQFSTPKHSSAYAKSHSTPVPYVGLDPQCEYSAYPSPSPDTSDVEAPSLQSVPRHLALFDAENTPLTSLPPALRRRNGSSEHSLKIRSRDEEFLGASPCKKGSCSRATEGKLIAGAMVAHSGWSFTASLANYTKLIKSPSTPSALGCISPLGLYPPRGGKGKKCRELVRGMAAAPRVCDISISMETQKLLCLPVNRSARRVKNVNALPILAVRNYVRERDQHTRHATLFKPSATQKRSKRVETRKRRMQESRLRSEPLPAQLSCLLASYPSSMSCRLGRKRKLSDTDSEYISLTPSDMRGLPAKKRRLVVQRHLDCSVEQAQALKAATAHKAIARRRHGTQEQMRRKLGAMRFFRRTQLCRQKSCQQNEGADFMEVEAEAAEESAMVVDEIGASVPSTLTSLSQQTSRPFPIFEGASQRPAFAFCNSGALPTPPSGSCAFALEKPKTVTLLLNSATARQPRHHGVTIYPSSKLQTITEEGSGDRCKSSDGNDCSEMSDESEIDCDNDHYSESDSDNDSYMGLEGFLGSMVDKKIRENDSETPSVRVLQSILDKVEAAMQDKDHQAGPQHSGAPLLATNAAPPFEPSAATGAAIPARFAHLARRRDGRRH